MRLQIIDFVESLSNKERIKQKLQRQRHIQVIRTIQIARASVIGRQVSFNSITFNLFLR